MNRVPAAGPVTQMIDVSHWQGLCDLSQMKSKGVQGVIAKCTEYNVDNTYAADRANAAKNGLIFGGYHFFHPSKDPAAQAAMFLKFASPKKGDLRPMLDWESTDGIPSAVDVTRGQAWLDIVEKATGVPPLIYMGPYFGQALSLPPSFARYPLVVAHYGTLTPLVPFPWKTWTIHQYSDKGQLPGINGHEDLDRFNGTLAQLQALCL